MEQPRQPNAKPNDKGQQKTSTGLPVNQSYTPPVAPAERHGANKTSTKNIFADLFPEEERLPASATINKPIDFVMAKLEDLHNFPLFFDRLEKIEKAKDDEETWNFEPADKFSIPVKVKRDREHLRVWETVDSAGFKYKMAIYLEPAQAGRGTVVRAMAVYSSPTAAILSKLEALFGKDALVTTRKNVQRFKALCETGSVPTIEGQPSGRDEDSVILKPSKESQTLKH